MSMTLMKIGPAIVRRERGMVDSETLRERNIFP
jgi:hypothetical protein